MTRKKDLDKAKLQGTFVAADRRRVPTRMLVPLSEVPKFPSWLRRKSSQDYWKELAPMLVKDKMLTRYNLSAFAHLAALAGNIQDSLDEDKDGTKEVPMYMISQYRIAANDFGLHGNRTIGNKEFQESNPFGRNSKRKKEAEGEEDVNGGAATERTEQRTKGLRLNS